MLRGSEDHRNRATRDDMAVQWLSDISSFAGTPPFLIHMTRSRNLGHIFFLPSSVLPSCRIHLKHSFIHVEKYGYVTSYAPRTSKGKKDVVSAPKKLYCYSCHTLITKALFTHSTFVILISLAHFFYFLSQTVQDQRFVGKSLFSTRDGATVGKISCALLRTFPRIKGRLTNMLCIFGSFCSCKVILWRTIHCFYPMQAVSRKQYCK